MRLQILSMLTALVASAIGMASFAGAIRLAPVQMLMVRQDGCHSCAAWEKDIGAAYGESAQGIAAPLRRINMHGPWPDGLALDRRPVLTPTFILIQNGMETGRIEGYAGETAFWAEIDALLSKRGITVAR